MMPAAKMLDPLLGVDIHMIQPPGPVPPIPVPHPYIGMIFDPMDLVPFVGATVTVGGLPRAQAGSNGKELTPHIPIGGVFVKPPSNESEVFMGSSTVSADGDAFSYMALPVLSCQDFGMPGPSRKKGSPPSSLVLPLTVVLSIPLPVLVGGAPTISLMALGMRLGAALLKALVKKFKNQLNALKKKAFAWLPPGKLKCDLLKAEPVNTVTGAVHVEQEDFELPGRVPLRWTRAWGPRGDGVLGRGWQTPADARIEVDDDGDWLFFDGGPGALVFPRPAEGLKLAVGGHAELTRLDADHWQVRTKEGQRWVFRKDGPRRYRVDAVRDAVGNGWSFIWGAEGLVALTDEGGRRVVAESRGGRLLRLTLEHPDFLAVVPLIRYEHHGDDLVAVYDAMEEPYRFAYDTAGRMVRHTSRTGLSFHYAYAGDRVVHAWGDGGLYDYTFEYSPGETRSTDTQGGVTTLLHKDGLPIREVDALGGETVYAYDEDGRTTSVTDPLGLATAYAYDVRGNLTATTLPDGSVTAARYDEQDHVVAVVDPMGAVWEQRWDARDHVVAQLQPDGASTRYGFSARGDLVLRVDPLGRETRYQHDAFGQLVAAIDPLGAQTSWKPGPRGEVQVETDALSRSTRYGWDVKGRLLSIETPTGLRTQASWDADDRLIEHVAPDGGRTRSSYFGIDKLALRALPDGTTVRYSYDSEERLISVENQRGERWRYDRDMLGRVATETDYWGGARRYAYDASGRVLAATDALGRTLQHRYDAAGRLVELRDDAGRAEKRGYDKAGRLVSTKTPDVATSRAFDAVGRLIEERFGDVALKLSWDAAGNLLRRTSSLGHTVEHTWDAANRLAALSVDGAVMGFERDRLGRVVGERAGGLERRFAWDDEDRLVGRDVLAAGRRLSFAYSWDAASNLAERRVTDGAAPAVQRFLYDPCGRVVEERDPAGRLRHFLRDPAGDLLQTRADGAGRSGALDGDRWRFDAAGNLIERTLGWEREQLGWDAWQRLASFEDAVGATSYGWEATGRRAWKQRGTERRSFGWLGDHLITERCGQDVREYVYLPDSFVPVAQVTAAGVAWLGTDINGAVTELHEVSGRLLVHATLGSKGAIYGLGAACRLRGQGQYEDEESGLYYTRHRFFDPRIEQFVSVDPLGLAPSENVYRLGPNVWGWVDPAGLAACKMSPSEARNKVVKGQGPRGISRIDSPKVTGEQWHAHLGPGEGSPAINIDGTWKHAGDPLTRAQADFLRAAGWKV